jgi:hypothetical protein
MDPKFFRKFADIITEAEQVNPSIDVKQAKAKQQYERFVKIINKVVDLTLDDPTVVKEFRNGSLFVSNITEKQAFLLFRAISAKYGAGIALNPINSVGEYSYDFRDFRI